MHPSRGSLIFTLLSGLAILLVGNCIADPIGNLDALMERNSRGTASFDQVLYDAEEKKIESTSGTLIFERPGKFKWHYKKPFEQLIICNGKKLWFYDVDMEQVIVNNVEGLVSASPAALIAGSESIDSHYILEVVRDDNSKKNWLKLIPIRDDGVFAAIKISFKEDIFSVMEMTDYLGQKTVITFTNFDTQVKFEIDAFEFTPPDGVEVLSQQ